METYLYLLLQRYMQMGIGTTMCSRAASTSSYASLPLGWSTLSTTIRWDYVALKDPSFPPVCSSLFLLCGLFCFLLLTAALIEMDVTQEFHLGVNNEPVYTQIHLSGRDYNKQTRVSDYYQGAACLCLSPLLPKILLILPCTCMLICSLCSRLIF